MQLAEHEREQARYSEAKRRLRECREALALAKVGVPSSKGQARGAERCRLLCGSGPALAIGGASRMSPVMPCHAPSRPVPPCLGTGQERNKQLEARKAQLLAVAAASTSLPTAPPPAATAAPRAAASGGRLSSVGVRSQGSLIDSLLDSDDEVTYAEVGSTGRQARQGSMADRAGHFTRQRSACGTCAPVTALSARLPARGCRERL